LFASFFATLLLAASRSVTFAQQAYGNEAYGNCVYSEGCMNSTPPSTVVAIGPSPSNPTAGRAVSVNIVNNQVISSDNYLVIVTPNFSQSQIEKIQLYQDDTLVGETTSTSGESYEIPWQQLKDGSYTVRVVVVLTDGTLIEQRFTVAVRQDASKFDGEGQLINKKGDAPEENVQRVQKRSIVGASLSAIANFVKRIVEATPKEIAYAVPYLFLAGLTALSAVLLYQTRSQLRYIAFLVALLKKDKQLADEKTTFIMLVSHHIRTPLTIIKSSIELALMGEAQDQDLLDAQNAANNLHAACESILSDVEGDHYLRNIVAPDVSKMQQSLYRSWKLILPAILSVTLLVGANIIYLLAGKTHIIIPSIVLQIVLTISLLVLLFNLIQRRRQRVVERGRLMQQRDHQLALDKARNIFIKRAVKEMSPLLDILKEKLQNLKAMKLTGGMNLSIENLGSLLERFELASELEQGKVIESVSEFDLKSIIQKAIEQSEESVKRKGLNVKPVIRSIRIYQNKFLVDYVFNALLDNAVRYSKDNTTVHAIFKNATKSTARVDIQNEGEGISSEKLDYLFQPFSSSSNVEVFTEQGIGLNLYLSRLMMRYIGGDISIKSVPNKTTTATIELPVDVVG